jgi:hypothetical protein
MINPPVVVILWSMVILGLSIWGMAGWGEEEEEGNGAAWTLPETGSINQAPPAQPGLAMKTGTGRI